MASDGIRRSLRVASVAVLVAGFLSGSAALILLRIPVDETANAARRADTFAVAAADELAAATEKARRQELDLAALKRDYVSAQQYASAMSAQCLQVGMPCDPDADAKERDQKEMVDEKSALLADANNEVSAASAVAIVAADALAQLERDLATRESNFTIGLRVTIATLAVLVVGALLTFLSTQRWRKLNHNGELLHNPEAPSLDSVSIEQ